jgi:hypothetical protein
MSHSFHIGQLVEFRPKKGSPPPLEMIEAEASPATRAVLQSTTFIGFLPRCVGQGFKKACCMAEHSMGLDIGDWHWTDMSPPDVDVC